MIQKRTATLHSIIASFLLIFSLLLQFSLFDHLCNIERPFFVSLLYNLTPAILIAWLCQLPKRHWLAWLCFLITDIWLIANCIYYRANGLFITWQVIQLAGNMNGFGSAITACLQWQQFLFPLLSVVSLIPLFFLSKERSLWTIITLPACALLLFVLSGFVRFHERQNEATLSTQWWSVLHIPQSEDAGVWATEYNQCIYLQQHSVATLLLKVAADIIPQKTNICLTPEDQQFISTIIRPDSAANQPKGHLLFILVESMEGWVLEEHTPDGEPICPNITNWTNTHPSLYTPYVGSQKLYGESGDGQMICLTGLLPIDDGAACNTYGANVFPNFAHFYQQSAIINPCPYTWNKNVVTYSYGFKQLIEPQKETPWWNDSIVLSEARLFLEKADQPACVLALTIDSHMPFSGYEHLLNLPDSISATERAYLSAMRHVDDEIGSILDWADTATCMKDAHIVITGDHYAFFDGLASHPRYHCPLVITSPAIQENIRPDVIFQMDIFPTILDVIGQSNYFWRGFGRSQILAPNEPFTDTDSVKQTIQHAYNISNKLIRLNYFASINQ